MNDENLIPLTNRTKSEQREIARLGGIKSGEARRRKKDIYQLTNAILNAQLDGKKQAAVKQIAGDSVVGEKCKGKKINWCEAMKTGKGKGTQEERAKARSKTFPGIAKAMAEQWSVE